MKRTFRILLLLVIVACATIFIQSAKMAEAIVITQVPLQEVDDIDNTPYPNKTMITYDAERVSCSSFTIDTAGQVKAIFSCQIKYNINGNVWLSKDSTGRQVIGEVVKITSNVTEVSWFLESGTYYLNSNLSYDPFDMNIALLYEKSKVTEQKTTTSFKDNTAVAHDTTVKGFLTDANPADYYSFDLGKKALVTIKYSFDSSASDGESAGHCILYDADELFLKEGTYTNSNEASQEYTCLLEPGKYYVKLQGLLGNTTLSVTPMYYDISLTSLTDNKWTKKHIHVNIDTSIEYSEIIVLFKDVKDSLLDNDDMWSKTNDAFVALDGESFIANKSGTYSVRITDKYGNNAMAKIKVSNIDVTVPAVKGVTDTKAYRTSVTPTWTDKQSGINLSKTTLNGKVIKSGTKITKEGKYTLKVYDLVGNYKTVVFYIDSTAPTAGVVNGKTYSDSVNLKFKDSVSGIKKVLVDGEEVTANTLYCCQDGDYTVELWDNAGNYRKIEFSIKRKF